MSTTLTEPTRLKNKNLFLLSRILRQASLILLSSFFSLQIFAQDSTLIIKEFHNSFLQFLPNTNQVVSIIVKSNSKLENQSNGQPDFFAAICSLNDGEVLKEVRLSDEDVKFIQAFNVSHDGLSFVVLLSINQGNSLEAHNNRFILKKYSLVENRWNWQIQLEEKIPYLDLTFSHDNKLIVVISAYKTILIESNTGTPLKNYNRESIVEANEYQPYFSLSQNGKYLAFWWNKFLRFSKGTESGIIKLIDLSWYGIKYLYHLGSIPNYLYVWDIYDDSLLCKIIIPYEAKRGNIVFTEDESHLLTEYPDFEYHVYSVLNKTFIRDFMDPDSDYPNSTNYSAIDYKTISLSANCFAQTYKDSILLIEYLTGKILHKLPQTTVAYMPINRYAMAFSPDGKYFAAVTSNDSETEKTPFSTYIVNSGNKLSLFSTDSWKKMWDLDISGD
ncbi:MAG: hypothetical protein IPM56_16995 [Ignavibacteriales bacterium]|nr:MAG: hypothetical protein IPM56_16995 [Ignavibacteriales bacterium]